jgi:recombinational DNA repair protein RecT
MLALGEVRGTNQNTSASDFFPNASAINVETADLTQGNGSHQGYYTMRNGGDAVTAKWQGTVTTVLGPNQQPQTSFNGTWEYTQGTGRYSGIQGSGVYEGEFLAEDRYLVRWQGDFRQ